ncbi:MAG: N-acetylmuramic acid 6-phosphate etherase [Phycisphaerales bacterium]|jgi:N-acetylmuramic acid 6-phosphate etherase|nr:N-acetylmuramic acid 6-phosphate etherase [Phycisphaerales bacterium]
MAHSIPPDRGHISTEQRQREATEALDLLSSQALVRLIAEDQHRAISAVEAVTCEIAALADEISDRMQRGGRLIYLGAGTSGRLGVLDASECPPTFGASAGQVIGIIAGGDSALRRSSEAREDDASAAAEDLAAADVGPGDTVVGIAAGGTTPWVLGGIEAAAARGAATALLCCAPRTAPAGCGQLIMLDTGAELLAGSTRLKAGTATKAALNALSTSVFVRLGAVHGDLMVDLRATNDKLLDRAIRILLVYAPHMDREEAAGWIHACEGHLKTAIVAVARGLTPDAASRHLDSCGGTLREALV